MQNISKSEVLAEVRVHAARRWCVAALAAVCATLLIWNAIARVDFWYLQVVLSALGLLSACLCYHLSRTGGGAVLLTPEALVDDRGRVLVQIADLARVERGLFAFKPTNGFLLRTNSIGPSGWQFGVWWRLGRRIGIGGMTPAAETKAMALELEALIAKNGAP